MCKRRILWVYAVVLGLSAPVLAVTEDKPAELNAKDAPIEVVEGKSEIVVYHNGRARTLLVSPTLLQSSRYLIKLAREDGQTGDAAIGQTTMEQRVRAQKLLYEANQQFIKGNITRTWELVDEAKALDPGHYRIKTMEGSLLYQMGSKDLAFMRWEESLTQNPDQPELVAIMKNAQGKGTP